MTFDSVFSTVLVCNDCNITELTDWTSTTITDIDRTICIDCADRNYPFCDHCSQFYSTEITFTGTVRPSLSVCESCLDSNYLQCNDCDNYVEYESTTTVDGDRNICERCLEDYSYCEQCEEYCHINHSIYLDHLSRSVCDYCLDRYYNTCEVTQEYYHREDLTETGYLRLSELPDDFNLSYYHRNQDTFTLSVCSDVLSDYFTRCDNCTDYYLNSSFIQLRGGDNICDNCCEVEEPENDNECLDDCQDITEYSRSINYPSPSIHPPIKGEAAKLGFRGKPKEKDFNLGVELEVESKDQNKRNYNGNLILRNFKNDMMLVSDGSISSSTGFEIVTAPCSFEYHKSMWDNFFSLNFEGLRSWDTGGRCGIHIHVSRKMLLDGHSGLHLGKLLVFVNEQINRKFMVTLAGRDSTRYCQYKRKKFTDYKNNRDRYEAINTTNNHTVEFRIFRGTLNKLHFFSNLEFVHAICIYTRDASMQDLHYQKFYDWVKSQPNKKYRNFIEFMVSKGY